MLLSSFKCLLRVIISTRSSTSSHHTCTEALSAYTNLEVADAPPSQISSLRPLVSSPVTLTLEASRLSELWRKGQVESGLVFVINVCVFEDAISFHELRDRPRT